MPRQQYFTTDAGSKILNYAGKNTDLIIMSTYGRSGVSISQEGDTLMSSSSFPSLSDIYQSLDRLVDRNSDYTTIESLGLSAEGRDIKAVYVTDRSLPLSDKEVAIVVCGRHGDELGTRGVGPVLIEWLLSPEGEETRRKQLVIVVPVANPDGCVKEEFFFPQDRLSETEQTTIVKLARVYRPDAVIDVHSDFLDTESVIMANTSNSAKDVFIHNVIRAKMIAEASRLGYPFYAHEVEISQGYNNFFSGMCYENFHSLAFGMEASHFALRSEAAAESSLAIIRSLLSFGNTRSFWEANSGYPNQILVGDLFTSIRPIGRNATERRQSRSEVWQNRKFFTYPLREALDTRTTKVVTNYSGEKLEGGFSLCCRIRGFPTIKGVLMNEKAVDPHIYKDECATNVCVDNPLIGGEYELVIEW